MDARTNFKVLPVTSTLIILCALAGSAYAASPTDKGTPGVEDDSAISTTIVVQPMRMHEPMPGEMKKDGMMKEEVMKGAKEKVKIMMDALQKEEAAMDRSTRESKPQQQAPWQINNPSIQPYSGDNHEHN